MAAYTKIFTAPGALLDRLTHRVHILEMNGESYRFKESVRRLGKKATRQQTTDADKTEKNQKEPEERP